MLAEFLIPVYYELLSGRGEIVSTVSQSPKGIPPKYIVEVDDCLPECCMLPVFSRQHFKWLKFRCSIRCLVEHKYLEWFILFTVMFSSFVLVRKKMNLILHFLPRKKDLCIGIAANELITSFLRVLELTGTDIFFKKNNDSNHYYFLIFNPVLFSQGDLPYSHEKFIRI